MSKSEVGLGLQSLVLLFSEMLGPVGLLTADQKWSFPCVFFHSSALSAASPFVPQGAGARQMVQNTEARPQGAVCPPWLTVTTCHGRGCYLLNQQPFPHSSSLTVPWVSTQLKNYISQAPLQTGAISEN